MRARISGTLNASAAIASEGRIGMESARGIESAPLIRTSYADRQRNRVNAGHMHSLIEVKSEQPGGKFCERTGEMENARLSHL